MGRKNHSTTIAQGHKRPKHRKNTKAVSLPNGRTVRVHIDKPHIKVGESVEAYAARLTKWREMLSE